MDLEEKLVRKKTVYQGRYLHTEEHTVRLPDGKEALREIVSPPDAVGVLPIDQEERVSLVRQYRPAISQVTLEIPAGLLEADEDRLETARRETIEEIGMVPNTLDFLFSIYHSVGFSTGKIAVFLGRDLAPSSETSADPEEFLEVVTLPFEEVFQMGRSGKIVDSKTLLALHWYKHSYNNPK
ncbi:MAG: NUDIX hydrolase [Nitrospiria bacterium]